MKISKLIAEKSKKVAPNCVGQNLSKMRLITVTRVPNWMCVPKISLAV